MKVADWYHPHRNILSREHESVLAALLDKTDEPYQQKALTEMLAAFGSPATRDEYTRRLKAYG